MKSEKHNRLRLKKSLVSKIFIKKGTRLNKGMIAIKRPGTGLLPKKIYTAIKRLDFIKTMNITAKYTPRTKLYSFLPTILKRKKSKNLKSYN